MLAVNALPGAGAVGRPVSLHVATLFVVATGADVAKVRVDLERFRVFATYRRLSSKLFATDAGGAIERHEEYAKQNGRDGSGFDHGNDG